MIIVMSLFFISHGTEQDPEMEEYAKLSKELADLHKEQRELKEKEQTYETKQRFQIFEEISKKIREKLDAMG